MFKNKISPLLEIRSLTEDYQKSVDRNYFPCDLAEFYYQEVLIGT